MFRRWRSFREKTMERYLRSLREEMEPWKKKVLRIHEEAEFLFYVDEMEPEREPACFLIRGELVKGMKEQGDRLLLMDGEGNILGRAVLGSSPDEKEVMRKGLVRHKRNEFTVDLTEIMDRRISTLNPDPDDGSGEYRRFLRSLLMKISLIMEDSTDNYSNGNYSDGKSEDLSS